MKLDRDNNETGKGKYALINMRKIEGDPRTPQELVAAILDHPEAVEFGTTGTEGEFFVIKLKDMYAQAGLHAYAVAAGRDGDLEYAGAIDRMAGRAGPDSPFCKRPD
ncbi:hypothetical protein [Magnetospirillum aberrantis]|uniref:Uncharacterized protein n=1 Tax=Magnetospirillum aberrantis SpK TaxID=908842 RepID=A0A7C9QV62_9PROT|nr:hypothetical protein [Magnetospirillum aberrantis]NFV80056.1 hypothetical protein [Magnetospirillum aberrantis SpK]